MHQKLQQNLDVLHYLIKDISTEQLAWRSGDDSLSLEALIGHLCRVEQLHQASLMSCHPNIPVRETAAGRMAFSLLTLDCSSSSFEAYARSRQQTVALLKNKEDLYLQINHLLFGTLTLSELVVKIDTYDRHHIRQTESMLRRMPLNPLKARAIQEIETYHRRYQPYLRQAESLLDIGVGTGLALNHIMRHNPHIQFSGVDVRDLRLPEVNIPLQIYNGHTLPFADNQFDVSLLFYVLHHCHAPVRVLAEAVRVTRQKLIFIEEFDRPDADETSLDVTERYGHRAIGLPSDMPYQLINQPDFEMMLAAHRLIVVERQLLSSRTTRPVQKFLYVARLALP